ncbi:unknown [Firmicutes bacterium CAG:882]|nr:unknown [Firmicutes bacterium CAG:882]
MGYDQVYDRIDELCEQRGWSRYKLVEESGIPQSSFYNSVQSFVCA